MLVGLLLLAGCAPYATRRVAPTEIDPARVEIPEEQLLDVGVFVFENAALDEEAVKKEGSNIDIRQAEGPFLACHLKNTLQRSSHWGGVRVLPGPPATADLTVHGRILSSNGERLVVAVEARDATGRTWLAHTYAEEAEESDYGGGGAGGKDAFQDLYNTIANDLADFRRRLTPAETRRIRSVSRLRFAADFSPEAFGGHLDEDPEGHLTPVRLPSVDDPQMARVVQVRERDALLLDTMNGHYEAYYLAMRSPYEKWRQNSRTERIMHRKAQKDALMRGLAGVLLIGGAIALEAGNAHNTDTLRSVMVLGGGKLLIDGVAIAREAEIHTDAIRELSDSFRSEMKPVVLELEGKQYELKGTAEEQYTRWRELLRQIYFAETGLVPAGSEADAVPAPAAAD